MNILEINLENCFGIGKLSHSFEFGQTDAKSFLIYAPNGTMKTSFAKTLDIVANDDAKVVPVDRVYENRTAVCNVKVDGNPIPPESILVVNAEDADYDASTKISSFIASKDLKKRYDEIYSQLENQKADYIRKLKGVSQSTDCEGEFVDTYGVSPKDTFFEILLNVSESLTSKPQKYNFKYNDIFDKKGNVRKFLDKNQSLLSQYISNYDDLLTKSNFFNKAENSFGTYQASELLNSTKDNSYFEAGHKFLLGDSAEIKSFEELRNLLDKELATILKDEKLKKSFDQVDKAIGANAELRAFKTVIEKDNLLLVKLGDYDKFRKEIWLAYVSTLATETLELVNFYKSKKEEIESIIKEAKKEFAIWEDIIKTFNERFYVPFDVSLVNQEDVVLKEDTASLEFHYKDPGNAPISKDKNSLLSILSKGEQRAFYILQLLFDIESRKQLNSPNLLVLDDIADSFDYKNKYAIIEYIKELHHNPNFKLIILTHNFDFYRTVASRLSLGRNTIFMATKATNRSITLNPGQYINDVFGHFKNNISKEKIFISTIPFTRNIIEYVDGTGTNYDLLTSCLHVKNNTDTITCSDILTLTHNTFPSTMGKTITFGGKFIKDLIYETADAIEQETTVDEILLENKIALSIAIRLKAEEYMIGKIPNYALLPQFSHHQTYELLKHFKSNCTDQKTISVLERVNLMTSENIHVNAFMYEPLIDISIMHLLDLYKTLKQLP